MAVIMAVTALGGCAVFRQREESNKLSITISYDMEAQFIDALRQKFPEISFDVHYYVGGNGSGYILESLTHNDATDIICTANKIGDEVSEKYLLDLSGYGFMGSFEEGILNSYNTDGGIYQVSGPITPRFIIYNKTLFDMNNWQVPANFEELVALCRTISQERPDVTPLGLGCMAMGFPFSLVAGFSQAGYLGSDEGKQSIKEYFMGNASIGTLLGEGLDMISELIDAHAFRADVYRDVWDLSYEELGNRKCAMSIVMNDANAVEYLEGTGDKAVLGEFCDDEYGMLPFFGKQEGEEIINLKSWSSWGINQRLKRGNPQKLENALKVMEFIGTAEGQNALITGRSQMPAIRDFEGEGLSDAMTRFWESHAYTPKALYLYGGFEDIVSDAGMLIVEAMRANDADGLKERFIKEADALHGASLNGEAAMIGELQRDFTASESAQLYRDAIAAQGFSDLTLSTQTGYVDKIVNRTGFGCKLYRDRINRDLLNSAMGYGAINASIMVMELTGQEIREMLTKGKMLASEDGTKEIAFPYGWSGAEVHFDADGTVTAVLIDGKEIEDTKSYRVAFSQGDYDEDFAAAHYIKKQDKLVMEAVEEYIRKNSPVKVPKVTR